MERTLFSDHLFKDNLFSLGSEVSAYCSSCKSNTLQTVMTLFEGEIRSVQCTMCNSSHGFRRPTGDQDDEISALPGVGGKKPDASHKPWTDLVQGIDPSEVPDYSPGTHYEQGSLFNHATFGLGYTAAHVGENKISTVFADCTRMLVHGRARDIPSTPPSNGRASRKGATTGDARPPAGRKVGRKGTKPAPPPPKVAKSEMLKPTLSLAKSSTPAAGKGKRVRPSATLEAPTKGKTRKRAGGSRAR